MGWLEGENGANGANVLYWANSVESNQLSADVVRHTYTPAEYDWAEDEWVDVTADNAFVYVLNGTKIIRFELPDEITNKPEVVISIVIHEDPVYSCMAKSDTHLWVAGPDICQLELASFLFTSVSLTDVGHFVDIDVYQNTMCAVGGNGLVAFSRTGADIAHVVID